MSKPSDLPDVLAKAETACAEAERILSLPVKERFAAISDATLHLSPLAKALRDTLDFHYGFADEYPTLARLVGSVFATLQESTPGRWQIRRFEMIEFQKRIQDLADYLRSKQ